MRQHLGFPVLAGALLLASTVPASAQLRPLERGEATSRLTNPAQAPWTPAVVSRLRVPAGFRIQVFGMNLGNPRMMAVSDSGAVYVTRRMTGDVVMLRDTNNDGTSDQMRVVASNLPWLNGIFINAGTVYLATDRHVYSAPIASDGGLGTLARIISDLPDAGQHPNRTLAIGPDGMLYITVGSTCNVCRETNPQNATIQQFMPNGTGRTTFAEGLRNTIGFGWHPATREMWAMDMGSDGRGDDTPPDELNRLEKGANYGWPWCYANREVDRLFNQPPPSGTREEYCATTRPMVQGYQAHSSPVALSFVTGTLLPAEYRNDAFITMRGSWNRGAPSGYKVVRLRFNAGQPAGFEDFITGWLSEDGQTHYGRPTGLIFHNDGSMLVSDDTNGVIYRVSPGTAAPIPVSVTAVSSGVGGMATTAVAQGGLITITGANLAGRDTAASSSSSLQSLPVALGNVQVNIAGIPAPLVSVTPTQIVAQVPYEVPVGLQPVVVLNNLLGSNGFAVMVMQTAPTLFGTAQGPSVQKAADYSRVSAANPATPGETLVVYATGLGQTNPPQTTGSLTASGAIASAMPYRVTIGGVDAQVTSNVASPGFAGLYQIGVRVPANVSGANLPLIVQMGSSSSSPVLISVAAAGSPVNRPAKTEQLDAEVQAVFEQYQSLNPKPLETLTPEEARRQPSVADAVRALLRSQNRTIVPEAVGSVQDRTIPGPAGPLTVRVYTPAGTGPFPAIVYFHGGGWVIATIDTYDASARALTNAAGAVVISAEYRKAPENKFPAAAEDAYAAVQWVFANPSAVNVNANRIAVAGESAGGNLAAAATMMARDRSGRMPVHQLLIYPVTNFGFDTPSYFENASAPFLTRAAMMLFWGHYLPGPQEGSNPYASVLRGDVKSLPPATVLTAGFDPLRDEGAAYADKLRQAGIQVDYQNYPSLSHEFFGMASVVSEARKAVQQAGASLKTSFQ